LTQTKQYSLLFDKKIKNGIDFKVLKTLAIVNF